MLKRGTLGESGLRLSRDPAGDQVPSTFHGYDAGHVDGQKDRRVLEVYDQIRMATERKERQIQGYPDGMSSREPTPGEIEDLIREVMRWRLTR